MKAYSIFDDFDDEAALTLQRSGIELTVHSSGIPRPNDTEMQKILEEYDCIIIGTSQKISESMFDNVASPRVIATASIGVDHISVPESKKSLVTIYNAPTANIQSVAEFTIACALACCKRLIEGNSLYKQGKNNKELSQKPEDLAGKTIGVVGAGRISVQIMQYAKLFHMNIVCWTPHPQAHAELLAQEVSFVDLMELVEVSDVISVNLPGNVDTNRLINGDMIGKMKENAVFISISRLSVLDWEALIRKAERNADFYVCLDIDVDNDVVHNIPSIPNVLITPHIAGGTVESRKRMFREVAVQIVKDID